MRKAPRSPGARAPAGGGLRPLADHRGRHEHAGEHADEHAPEERAGRPRRARVRRRRRAARAGDRRRGGPAGLQGLAPRRPVAAIRPERARLAVVLGAARRPPRHGAVPDRRRPLPRHRGDRGAARLRGRRDARAAAAPRLELRADRGPDRAGPGGDPAAGIAPARRARARSRSRSRFRRGAAERRARRPGAPAFPGRRARDAQAAGRPGAPRRDPRLVHSNESLANYADHRRRWPAPWWRRTRRSDRRSTTSRLYTVADLSTCGSTSRSTRRAPAASGAGRRCTSTPRPGPPLAGDGTVRYVGPLLEQDTRVSYGRVVLDNPDRRWQPGLYVDARGHRRAGRRRGRGARGGDRAAAEGPRCSAPRATASSPSRWSPGAATARSPRSSRASRPGAPIVVSNAFLLKAELGKSEAHHEH